MTAQIIFFLALALFISLIIRRVPAVRVTGLLFIGFLGRILSSLGDLMKKLRGRFSLSRFKKTRTSSFGFARVQNQPLLRSSHRFWAEEAQGDQTELLSHFEEGEKLFREGKFKEAEHFFLRSATRNPKDPRIYAKLGLIYLQTKNYSDAIEALKVAVKLDKYNPSRYYNLSLAYKGNNDTQRAIVTIREAISLDPVTPKYRQLLERLLEKK